MSLRFILKYEIEKIIERLLDLNKKEIPVIPFEENLRSMQFKDFSSFFPNEYFLIDFEPLYFFYQSIKRNNYVLLNNQSDKNQFPSSLLDKLFVENNVGLKKLLFSDFKGVQSSKESGNCSFEDFKNQQYERNLYNLKNPYYYYDLLRHDIFNTDKEGNSNSIESAIELKWSNSIYASNSDRSHRFALLCKWNDLENRNDSELFDTREISINTEKKREFLENYYGFFINSTTALYIIRKFNNDSYVNLSNYCSSFKTEKDEPIVLLFHKKAINNNVLNVFLQSENSIFINKLINEL